MIDNLILQEETPYLPPDGQSLKAGSISTTNLEAKQWDDGTGHFKGSTMATETKIQCRNKSKVVYTYNVIYTIFLVVDRITITSSLHKIKGIKQHLTLLQHRIGYKLNFISVPFVVSNYYHQNTVQFTSPTIFVLITSSSDYQFLAYKSFKQLTMLQLFIPATLGLSILKPSAKASKNAACHCREVN